MRKAGILMHISSLPGRFGIGTVGKQAFDFVDFLAQSGQRCWQVLPLNPTEFGNSPYQSPSVFAGNPNLIDLESLLEDGLLTDEDLEGISLGEDEEMVDFPVIREEKPKILRKAFERFQVDDEYSKFQGDAEYWLENYALFMALKEHFEGKPWYEWDEDIKNMESQAVHEYTDKLWDKIAFYKFEQYIFYKQWNKLKTYAGKMGIEIIGDIPIYVSGDSCDVWVNRSQFQLTEEGIPERIAGCPPDAFSEDGQMWGNPLYDWDAMEKDGYSWWVSRMKAGFELYDIIRLDHFRGFEAYYAIPSGDPDAKHGVWEKVLVCHFLKC